MAMAVPAAKSKVQVVQATISAAAVWAGVRLGNVYTFLKLFELKANCRPIVVDCRLICTVGGWVLNEF